MIRFGLLAAAALSLAGAAQAAEGRFIHPADKNHDDRIDKAEWVAYGLPEAAFATADADHDGKINGPEFVAYDKQAHPERQHRHPQPHQP